MWRAADDAADVQRAGQLRLEWIRNIVLPELAGAPTRDIKEPVVEREIDVGDQRRDRLEAFEQRRQDFRIGRFGGNLDDLLDPPRAVVAMPVPDGRRQILQRHDYAEKSVGLGWIVRRAQLKRHLLFLADIE